MKITQEFSFNNGAEFISERYSHLLDELYDTAESIDAEACRLKVPQKKERNRLSKINFDKFYSPPHINAAFKYFLYQKGWEPEPKILTRDEARQGSRAIDFVKEGLGLEIQIGKYAFLTYDIVAKMPIFWRHSVIECGIELCPTASMLPHLSTGIGSFEQVRWDLEQIGDQGNSLPVLLLGFESNLLAEKNVEEQRGVSRMARPEIRRTSGKKLNKKTIGVSVQIGRR